MRIKVLKGVAGAAAFLREKRSAYATNRAEKAFGLWTLLHNSTTSGKIQYPQHQSENLEKLCKVSFRTLQRWAMEAEKLQLLSIKFDKYGNHSAWTICSIDKVCTAYLLDKEYIEIEYDLQNEKQQINWIFKALEELESQERQAKAIANKIQHNPQIAAGVNLELKQRNCQPVKLTMGHLSYAQRETFATGAGSTLVYSAIHLVNPDLSRNRQKVAYHHRIKNVQSVTYMRRGLVKRDLIDLTPRPPILCHYRRDLIANEAIRGKKAKAARYYDNQEKVATWYLPPQITVKLRKPAPGGLPTKL